MSVSQLQASAENEADKLMKKYDINGDGVLTKEELQFFLHAARGSTQLHDQGFASKIPKTNESIAHELTSNSDRKPKKQLQDEAQKSSTKVFSTKVSNMPLSRKQLKQFFKNHDSDNDGFLNIKELTKAFGSLGSMIPFFKAQYGLAYADADEDGLISEREFDKLIDYATKTIWKK